MPDKGLRQLIPGRRVSEEFPRVSSQETVGLLDRNIPGVAEAAMIQTPANREAVGLQVVFTRHGDRYRHSVQLCRQGQLPVLLLVSEEGASDQRWPASPPLQQLSLEQLSLEPGLGGDRRPVALLLGMAGAGHWSMSVESSARAIEFDVACRGRVADEPIGSSYLLQLPAQRQPTSGDAVLSADGVTVRLQVKRVTNHELPRIELAQGRLSIGVPVEVLEGTATVRWKYRVVLD